MAVEIAARGMAVVTMVEVVTRAGVSQGAVTLAGATVEAQMVAGEEVAMAMGGQGVVELVAGMVAGMVDWRAAEAMAVQVVAYSSILHSPHSLRKCT